MGSRKDVILQLIKKGFTPLAELIAAGEADSLEQKGGLLVPKEGFLKKKTKDTIQSVEGAFMELQEKMAKAVEILRMERSSEYHSFLSFSIEEVLSTPSKDETFQGVLGWSDEMLLWIYSVGHRLSTEGKNEEALSIFTLLTVLNPLVADYLVAKGLIERLLQKNEEALNSLALASFMNPDHPIARYNSVEIYLLLGKEEDARLEFEVLEKIVREKGLTDLAPAVEAIRQKVKFTRAS